MKRFLALFLMFILALSCISCNDEKKPSSSSNGASTESSTKDENQDETPKGHKIAGNSYVADIDTLNVGKEAGANSSMPQNTFIAFIKSEFKNSKIEFPDENAVSLTGTNNKNHDFSVQDCTRLENELFAEIKGKGNIDILIYEDKVSFMCDFFKGWQISIDYKIVK